MGKFSFLQSQDSVSKLQVVKITFVGQQMLLCPTQKRNYDLWVGQNEKNKSQN